MNSFLTYKMDISNIFGEIARLIKQLQGDNNHITSLVLIDLENKCISKANQVVNYELSLLVLGNFCSGKSSVLNAILGEEILSTGVVPSTSIISHIRHGEYDRVHLCFNNSLSKTFTYKEFEDEYKISMEDLECNPEGVFARFRNITNCSISSQQEYLKNGITVIDTPGLCDRPCERQKLIDLAKTANGILYVISAPNGGLARDEKDFLETLIQIVSIENIFFIINKCDLLYDGVYDELKTFVDTQIKELFYNNEVLGGDDGLFDKRVFYVSALNSLKANKNKKLEVSSERDIDEFRRFEESLNEFISEQSKTLLPYFSFIAEIYRSIENMKITYLSVSDQGECVVTNHIAYMSYINNSYNQLSKVKKLFTVYSERLIYKLQSYIFQEIREIAYCKQQMFDHLSELSLYSPLGFVKSLFSDDVLNNMKTISDPIVEYLKRSLSAIDGTQVVKHLEYDMLDELDKINEVINCDIDFIKHSISENINSYDTINLRQSYFNYIITSMPPLSITTQQLFDWKWVNELLVNKYKEIEAVVGFKHHVSTTFKLWILNEFPKILEYELQKQVSSNIENFKSDIHNRVNDAYEATTIGAMTIINTYKDIIGITYNKYQNGAHNIECTINKYNYILNHIYQISSSAYNNIYKKNISLDDFKKLNNFK